MKKIRLIAPLAAVTAAIGVATPLITSCTPKQDIVKETQELVNKANQILGGAVFETATQAVNKLADKGVTLTQARLANSNYRWAIDTKQGQVIVLDIRDDSVVFSSEGYKLSKNTEVNVWMMVDSYDKNCKFAQYFTEDFHFNQGETGKEFVVYGSVDVGKNTNVQYIYLGDDETPYSNEAIPANVTIRSNSEYLVINAKDSTVNHYGVVNNCFIKYVKNYNEHGVVATMKATAEATEYKFGPNSAVDLLEVTKSGSAIFTNMDAMIYAHVKNDALTGEAWGTELEVVEISTTSPAPSFEPNKLYRLTNNVEYTGTLTVDHALPFDLNGFNITFKEGTDSDKFKSVKLKEGTASTAKAAIEIQNNGQLYVFDSSDNMGIDLGKIDITNGSVVLNAAEPTTDDKAPALCLNAGEITSHVEAAPVNKVFNATIVVKGNCESTTEEWKSTVTIYGGNVSATGRSDADADASSTNLNSAIYLVGAGATLDSEYAEVSSEFGACVRSTGNAWGSNNHITINGGEYTCSNSACAFYLPNESNLEFNGGRIIGGTCFRLNGGTAKINNGTFLATGDYVQNEGTLTGDRECNGSVFWLTKSSQYLTQLNLTVNNCIAISCHGSVVKFSTNMTKEQITIKHNVLFKDGLFSYKKYDLEYGVDKDKQFYATDAFFTDVQGGVWYLM